MDLRSWSPTGCLNVQMCWMGRMAGSYCTVFPLVYKLTPEPVTDEGGNSQYVNLFTVRPGVKELPEQKRWTNGKWYIWLSADKIPENTIRSAHKTIEVCVNCWMTLWYDWETIIRVEVDQARAWDAYCDRRY